MNGSVARIGAGGGIGAGRYAPSPTGDLHLGNLRTAVLAWLFARASARRFLLRVDDLDPARSRDPSGQLADLAALGLDHDGPVVVQSRRRSRHDQVIADLDSSGLVYECFCTRREIQDAVAAPHGAPVPEGAYPGTCRDLTDAERDDRRATRPAALRLRTDGGAVTIADLLHGEYTGAVDDLVLRRNDGAIAYNLAVVVDDDDAGVDQVVRGDDLLPSTPRQAHLYDVLGRPRPQWAHVPLAVNADGRRLAKRDGAVTMADLADRGVGAEQVLSRIAASLGLAEEGEAVNLPLLLERFDPHALPREPWVVLPDP